MYQKVNTLTYAKTVSIELEVEQVKTYVVEYRLTQAKHYCKCVNIGHPDRQQKKK